MPKLYVVATPIGNLREISTRTAMALEEADLIAAEDTRVTAKLLNHLKISKPMISCHRHNESRRSEELIARMLGEDLTVALTSDAGTPGISDPGHLLVAAAWEAGIEVIPISGPSAVATALSACGFDAREYGFYGFLPRENKALREKLTAIRRTGVPIAVLYESPHRVVNLIEQVAALHPECRAAVCCDLTKRYELIVRGEIGAVLAKLAANPNVERGEYCVVLDLSSAPEPAPIGEALPPEAQMMIDLLNGFPLREAARRATEAGHPRNLVYKSQLRIKAFLNGETTDEEESP